MMASGRRSGSQNLLNNGGLSLQTVLCGKLQICLCRNLTHFRSPTLSFGRTRRVEFILHARTQPTQQKLEHAHVVRALLGRRFRQGLAIGHLRLAKMTGLQWCSAIGLADTNYFGMPHECGQKLNPIRPSRSNNAREGLISTILLRAKNGMVSHPARLRDWNFEKHSKLLFYCRFKAKLSKDCPLCSPLRSSFSDQLRKRSLFQEPMTPAGFNDRNSEVSAYETFA